MPIAVICPSCDARLNAPDAAAGKTVKCPKCKASMTIPTPDAESDAGFETVDEPVPPKKITAKKKSDVVLDDDQPRSKKRRRDEDDDDEDDDRPRKKKGKKKPASAGMSPAIMIAIAGGVLFIAGGSFAAYWFGVREEKPKDVVKSDHNAPMKPGPIPGGPMVPGGPRIPGLPAPPDDSDGLVTRAISNNNLKQIGLAMHNFADTHRSGFPAGIHASTGKVGLSWRVAILPYIEQDELYKQFKLDEPWDSEHNKKLIPLIPRTYTVRGRDTTEGLTYYRSFSGEGTAFPPPKNGLAGKFAFGLKFVDISDGSSNTGLVVEAGDPVVWTKPDELAFTPNGALPSVGGMFGGGYRMLFCDGSVREMKPDTAAATLKGIITARGGEVVDFSN